MTLADILKHDAGAIYRTTEKLFRKVDDLEWKPATGTNWMTTAQLLRHCTEACGFTIHGFVEEGWGTSDGEDGEGGNPDDMLPPAEEMPAVGSVEEALELLDRDRELCMRVLSDVEDERLLNERSRAPWGGPEVTLFQHCSGMIWHLGQHKGQLFYYLKLQGKDVDTMDLWG